MTEQTPKLDVQTLEYILSLAGNEYNRYKRLVSEAYENRTYNVQRANGKVEAMHNFQIELAMLIHEQQEVAA